MNAFIPRPAREYTDEQRFSRWMSGATAEAVRDAIKLHASGKQPQKAIDEAKATSKVAA